MVQHGQCDFDNTSSNHPKRDEGDSDASKGFEPDEDGEGFVNFKVSLQSESWFESYGCQSYKEGPSEVFERFDF